MSTKAKAYQGWHCECVIVGTPPEMTIRNADEAFFIITGYRAEAMAAGQLRLSDLIRREAQEAFWHAAQQADQGGLSSFEHRLIDAAGRERHMLAFVYPLQVEAEKAYRILWISVRDVYGSLDEADRILDNLPCGVARYHVHLEPGKPRESGLYYANETFYKMVGYDDPAALKQASQGDIVNLVMPDEKEHVDAHILNALTREGVPVPVNFTLIRGDGRQINLMVTLINLVTTGDNHVLLCTFQDLTPLHQIQEALRAQTEQIALVAEATGERFMEIDVARDRLTLVAQRQNPATRDEVVEHFSREDMLSRFVDAESMPVVRQLLEELTQGPAHGSADIRACIREGAEKQWFRVHYSSVGESAGKVDRIVGRLTNIQAEKAREGQLRERADRDGLTQLYSRGAAEMLMEHFLRSENDNHSEQKHAVLMIDLDNFKEINDRFSHSFGDVVLVDIADILRDSFRATDIVGRLGGDEFIVLMKNYRSVKAIEMTASRICTAIQRKFTASVSDTSLSASIGIARYPADGLFFQALYHKADIANYESKALGKNRWSLYTDGIMMRYSGQRRHESEAASLQREMEATLLDTLGRTNDRIAAICDTLGVMTRRFDAQRAYIIRFAADGSLIKTPFRWEQEGYAIGEEQRSLYPAAEMQAFCQMFDAGGLRIVRNEKDIPLALRPFYRSIGVRSMLHYAFSQGGSVVGFIGLDDCVHSDRTPSPKVLDSISYVMRLLMLFIQQRTPFAHASSFVATTGLLDAMDTLAYMIDADTHELVFINRAFMQRIPSAGVGALCYQALHGRETPCDMCPMHDLQRDAARKQAVQALYFAKEGFWGKVYAAWCDLGGESSFCILQCEDVTAYKAAQAADEGRT